jgi:SAM-dependent methyltransferase
MSLANDYNAYYYSHYQGPEYDPTTAHWQTFFATISLRLTEIFQPKSSLDAGCAMGILVGAMRERGVDADGIDISEYAIAKADERAAGHVWVADLTQPLAKHYDIATCIEVLEHIEAGQVEQVIENLCSAADTIVFSSTPDDFNEGTHINVRPPAYWLGLFADHGFIRRFDVDCSFISPWAVAVQRRTAAQRQLVTDYETALWDMHREIRGKRVAVINRDRELTRLTSEQASAASALADVQAKIIVEQLRAENAEQRAHANQVKADHARTQLEGVTHSITYRAARSVTRRLGWVRRLARKLK